MSRYDTSDFEKVRASLPKAQLFSIKWDSKHFYFAKFRHANNWRLQIGWLVVNMRAPWLEHSARALYPHLFSHKKEPAISWRDRVKWAEKFLSHYADGKRQKLLGGYDFHAAVKHLAAAVQQIIGSVPECPYCGTTEGLRAKSSSFAPGEPEYICEGCFTLS
jgi:hypothetical protein